MAYAISSLLQVRPRLLSRKAVFGSWSRWIRIFVRSSPILYLYQRVPRYSDLKPSTPRDFTRRISNGCTAECLKRSILVFKDRQGEILVVRLSVSQSNENSWRLFGYWDALVQYPVMKDSKGVYQIQARPQCIHNTIHKLSTKCSILRDSDVYPGESGSDIQS
jgi:hypothetical protein